MYLRLLHEVIEFLEYLNEPGQINDQLRAFQTHIIPEIVRLMQKYQPSFTDNTRHKIRRYSLEIIQLTPFPDSKSELPFENIVSL